MISPPARSSRGHIPRVIMPKSLSMNQFLNALFHEDLAATIKLRMRLRTATHHFTAMNTQVVECMTRWFARLRAAAAFVSDREADYPELTAYEA